MMWWSVLEMQGVVGGAWSGVMWWEWLACCFVLKLRTGQSVCKNCGECMGIDRVTLHRGTASGATTIKGALYNRTWCIY